MDKWLNDIRIRLKDYGQEPPQGLWEQLSTRLEQEGLAGKRQHKPAAWMLWRTDRPYETQQLAQKVETRPAPPKRHEVQMPEGQDEKVAESHRYEKSAVMPRQRNLLTQETEQEMEESLQDASDAQADCFGEETNKMAELKEQIDNTREDLNPALKFCGCFLFITIYICHFN